MSETHVIIEPYGIGHAVALVRDNLLEDLLIDPKTETDQLAIGSIVAANPADDHVCFAPCGIFVSSKAITAAALNKTPNGHVAERPV